MSRRSSGTKPRILVIYKKSAYQIYVRERKHARFSELIESQHPSVERLVESHDDHVGTLESAREILRRLGARAVFRYRSDTGTAEDFDLVVTLGGDGTLLWASHVVGPGKPMVAINTAPQDSVGYFCAGDKSNLEGVLAAALNGQLKETRFTRMQVELDAVVVSTRVLNDALFCHAVPAATSRYLLRRDGIEEDQKSSGIWIGPAAGSTAAQRSAGGKVLPPASEELQFIVREPYEPTGKPYRLAKGLIEPGECIEIQSKIRDGRLFLDGPHQGRTIPIGATMRMSRSPEPLTLLGFHRRKSTP